MAAVDRRPFMIRRGTTPAAPKPINLPSQKLENQGLVPDVEIVPRGTFCWGRAGRSSAASGKNNERTDSAPLHSESSKAVDTGTDIESDNVLLGLDEGANPSCPVESSTTSTRIPDCIGPIETTGGSPSFEPNDASLDNSPAASDASSLSGSSCFENSASPSATHVTTNDTRGSAAQLEEQKGSFGVCEGSETVSNLESKQGTCGVNESLPECQDFGYFEGFYCNNSTSFSPGMPYSNSHGMAFGAGLHPEPSQHDGFYSFLGVPYYDSTKNKEIVVITMVGNPGLHGNYFPHPSLPDQYGRSTVFGNFPPQFGHFDQFAVPGENILHGRNPMSAEMNSMCSGEQGEFVCYEQGYYEDSWIHGTSIGDLQSGHGAFWRAPFSTCKNIPRRAGRQKYVYRNKRAASKEALPAAPKPERKVTLLTKVSQHEVIISSLQKTNKSLGNELAGGFSAAISSDQKSIEAPPSDPDTAIAECSNADRIHEIVDIEKNHVAEVVSGSVSAQGTIAQQAQSTGSKNVDFALLSSHDVSCLESRTEASVSESLSTTIYSSTSHSLGNVVECHEDRHLKKERLTCEADSVTFNGNGYSINAAELPESSPLNDPTESAILIEQANEQVNREKSLCRIVALLPHKHNQGLPNQKSDMKWRRKGAVTVTKLGRELHCAKAQRAVVDCKASSLPSVSDKNIASADSLPNESLITKAMPQGSTPLSSCVQASLSASEDYAASKEKFVAAASLNCAVPDCASKIKKSRKFHKAVSGNVDIESVAESWAVQNLKISSKLPIKTQPFAEGHSLNLKNAPCGLGKRWRPKLQGAGHGESATKAPTYQPSKAASTIKFSQPREVSCSVSVENLKHQQQNIQQGAKMVSLTGGARKNFNNLAEKEQNVECPSMETVPLRYSSAEQRENTKKLIREQKWLQQEPLVSMSEGSKFTCRQDMVMDNVSFEACISRSNSLDDHLGADHQVSKILKTNDLSSTTRTQTREKFMKLKETLHSSPKSDKPMLLAAQPSKSKDLNREVNSSSKAASGMRQQSLVKKNEELKQLPVKKVPQWLARPGHLIEKTKLSALVTGSVPNFGRDFVKQGPYVASWGGREIVSRLDAFKCERFDKNNGQPQGAHRNLIKQSMHRWQQRRVCCKVMHGQEQHPATTTCGSLTKPCEEGCTFSGGKPGVEDKKHLLCATLVSWKPKQTSSVQVSKEKCKEGGKDNPSLSAASQKERDRGEHLLTEHSSNVSLSSPCESGQQVKDSGKQGLKKPASQLGMALKELPATIPSSSCENGQHMSGVDKKESLKYDSQMKMDPEECLIVTSSSSTTMFTPGKWQDGNTGKQSYDSVLDMEHSAVIQNSFEQAAFGSNSQPVSAVATSLKLEVARLTRSVKPHQNHLSWRRKAVSIGPIAVTSAFSKESNENDPLASTHVKEKPKKHINSSPARTFAASGDLHVPKNNGWHPVRAFYGLPYSSKDYPQLQKPLDHQVKLHADGAFSVKLLDRANNMTCVDGESHKPPKSVVMKEMKHTTFSPSQLHPASKSELPQHHVYAAKQVHFAFKQHPIVSNRRPFSTKLNFSHDDNKKSAQDQLPLSNMSLPMEQGYRRPFFAKPSVAYDDSKTAVHHRQFLPRAPERLERIKISENTYAQGSDRVESLGRSRSYVKPGKHGQLHYGRKLADTEKKGWVVKTEARCGGQ